MERVSFPRLKISIPVTDTAFTVFGVEIKWYAIMITLGIFLAWLYVSKNCRRVGLHPDNVFDVLFGGVIGGIIGARIYYVIFEWQYYGQHLNEVFDIRNGGLAFYGGLIGGLLVGYIIARIRKVRIPPLLDLVGPAFLIGQSIGRWGNFFNEEAFGANTTWVLGMTSPKIEATLQSIKNRQEVVGWENINPSEPVHPCFFYESVWCAIGFFVLNAYSKKKRKFDGDVFLLYLAWYGFGRFFIEGLRMDSLYWGPFRVSQILSLLLCVGALIVRFIIIKKVKANPEKYPLYKDTEVSKEHILATDLKLAKGKKTDASREKDHEVAETSALEDIRDALDVAEALDTEEAEKKKEVEELIDVLSQKIDSTKGL